MDQKRNCLFKDMEEKEAKQRSQIAFELVSICSSLEVCSYTQFEVAEVQQKLISQMASMLQCNSISFPTDPLLHWAARCDIAWTTKMVTWFHCEKGQLPMCQCLSTVPALHCTKLESIRSNLNISKPRLSAEQKLQTYNDVLLKVQRNKSKVFCKNKQTNKHTALL